MSDNNLILVDDLLSRNLINKDTLKQIFFNGRRWHVPLYMIEQKFSHEINLSDNKNLKTFNLQVEYFVLIQNGLKTIEGRLNKTKFKEMNKGDIIIVKCVENKEEVIVEIIERNEYKSFREMLEKEGLNNV